MVQLAVLSPSTGLRSLHALDLELAAPGALPLAPRLWRLPRDLDTPPPSVAALLQPLARSTTLPGLLDGLSESPPPPTLRPWRLHFEAHAAAPSEVQVRASDLLCAVAQRLRGPPAALVDGDAAAELHLVRTRRLWYLCAGRPLRAAPAAHAWARRPFSFSAATSHHLAALAVSVAASASPVAPRRLLDPCCGSGTVLHAAALRGLRATGVDLNAATVEGAAANLAACAPAGGYAFAPTVAVGDASEAAALPGDADLVVASLPWGRNMRLRDARALGDLLESVAAALPEATFVFVSAAPLTEELERAGLAAARVVPVNANAKHSSVLTVARVGAERRPAATLPPSPRATAEVLEGGGLKGEAADDVAALLGAGRRIAVQVRAADGRAWVAARVVHTTAVDGGGGRLKTALAWEAAAPPGLPAELALERYAGPNWRVD